MNFTISSSDLDSKDQKSISVIEQTHKSKYHNIHELIILILDLLSLLHVLFQVEEFVWIDYSKPLAPMNELDSS